MKNHRTVEREKIMSIADEYASTRTMGGDRRNEEVRYLLNKEIGRVLRERDEAEEIERFRNEEIDYLRENYGNAEIALDKARERVAELERICAETYQALGILADEAGRFDDPFVTKALDNLSSQRVVHENLLPFPANSAPRASKPLRDDYADVQEFDKLGPM